MKNMLYVVFLICASISSNANQNINEINSIEISADENINEINVSERSVDENINEINVSEISINKEAEIKNFIVKYAVKNHIDGFLHENFFQYNIKKFDELKRKLEKASIYNIKIEKVDGIQNGINKNGIIFIKNNYKITFINNGRGRNKNLIKPLIDREYIYLKQDNDYSMINVYGEDVLDVDSIITDYIVKSMGLDIKENHNLKENISKKEMDYIIEEKKKIISSEDKVIINVCTNNNNYFDNFLSVKTNDKSYSLLINEECYNDIYSPIEEELYKINNKNEVKKSDEIVTFDLAKKNRSLNFELNNKEKIFLKLGKFFLKEGQKFYIKKEDQSKPYVYIKTNVHNLTINFALFRANKKCLSYSENKTKIDICNLKDSENLNKITEVLKIYQ